MIIRGALEADLPATVEIYNEAIRGRISLSALLGCIFAHNQPSLQLFEHAGFERWGFLPRIARVDGLERGVVIMGRHVPAQT